MILPAHTQRDIRNAALSALHYIAFDQKCEVSDILALLNDPAAPAAHPVDGTVPAKLAAEEPSHGGSGGVQGRCEPTPPTQSAVDADLEEQELIEIAAAPENATVPSQAEASDALVSAPIQDRPAPNPTDPVVSEPSAKDSDTAGEVNPSTSPVSLTARPGSKTAKIIEVHLAHPGWTSREIAEHLGYTITSVAVIVSDRKIPVRKVTREEFAAHGLKVWEGKHAPAVAEPVEARQPAPAEAPATPPEPPRPSPFAPVEDDQPRKIKRPSGTLFWLRHSDGRYLHRMVHTLTSNRKEAWTGTAAQIAGCRRNYEIARDLREHVVEKEPAR